MRRLILVAVVAGLLVAGVLASPESPERGVLDSAGLRLDAAAAAGSNRAGVIIDDGSSVRRVCIRFNGTLTGVEALQRAASATVAPFGGLGVAVCGINGVGCPGDNSCLTCQQPKFWSYSRAPSGSTSFSVASSGASGSTVRDGDVEGWRWGGGKPAHVSAAKICGEAAAPPPVSASPPPLSNGGSGGGGGGGPAQEAQGSAGGSGTGSTTGGSASTGPAVQGEQATNDTDAETAEPSESAAATTTTAEDPTSDADTPGSGDDDGSEDALAGSGATASDASSTGSVVGLLVLGAVLVGAAVAFVLLRRRSHP